MSLTVELCHDIIKMSSGMTMTERVIDMVNLKKMREDKGYTQKRLADETGVTRTAIANIEGGFSKPSIELAKKIGEVLGFDWTLFF